MTALATAQVQDAAWGTNRRYQRESFIEMFAEARPLLERHYREIAHYQDIPLEPDVERYRAMDEAGNLRIYTARVGATGALVGYVCYVVLPNAHYRSSVQAVQDVIYVAPEWRNKLLGYRLLQFSEKELAKEGVQAVYQHEKIAHPELGRMLRAMGYEAVDTIYAKRLDIRKVKG